VHDQRIELAKNYHLVSSFHPSRLNVNTGRLTRLMFNDMFSNIKALLDGSSSL
jgi:uracil-DNA glycosylase